MHFIWKRGTFLEVRTNLTSKKLFKGLVVMVGITVRGEREIEVKTCLCLCVSRIDGMWASIHVWKAKACTFSNVTLRPATTYKHKFFLLCCLISSSGDYYPSPFHSSGRVVAQLDEYLIWNVAFRQRWFIWKTGFRGLVRDDTRHKYKTSLMSLWHIKK